MNFFEQELRKLFAEQFPNATYVGRNCYIPLDNQIRACISFKTNEEIPVQFLGWEVPLEKG